jgi:hypothetical protein
MRDKIIALNKVNGNRQQENASQKYFRLLWGVKLLMTAQYADNIKIAANF